MEKEKAPQTIRWFIWIPWKNYSQLFNKNLYWL